MATVTTRPGIKVKFGVKYPAKIVANTPLSATLSGATWTLSLDTESILGGKAWVWQIKAALLDAGVFDTVEATIPASTNTVENIIWNSGGLSKYGDTLSDIIQSATGWTNDQMVTFYQTASVVLYL